MAVYRVERTHNYTIMSNFHLKDTGLSLKAKGLLSMFLSFPDDWNYSTRGLAAICKEGVDAIGNTIKELERAGYIIRRQLRGANGRITDTEYLIYERPQEPGAEPPAPDAGAPDTPPPSADQPDTSLPDADQPDTPLPDTPLPDMPSPDMGAPDTENPDVVGPDMAGPHMEKSAQLNNNQYNTQKLNTNRPNTHSFPPSTPSAQPVEGRKEIEGRRDEIREQIEYDMIATPINRAQLDEFVEIMLEVALSRAPTMKIGRDAEYPTALVQQRFEQINSGHIEKVLDGIRENTTRVWNTRAYLLAALFNAPSTIDNHYTMLVNHDLSG